MDNIDIISNHIKESIQTKNRILNNHELLLRINEISKICHQSLLNNGKIIFCGNGGSAADSQHLAAEFVSKLKYDRNPLCSLALTTDTSVLTAIGNDYGFEHLFSRQIEAIASKDDVIVFITTSGNSLNILNGIEKCKSLNLKTVLLTGELGGKAHLKSDFELNIPSNNTAFIQESHIMIGHIICSLVEDYIFKK